MTKNQLVGTSIVVLGLAAFAFSQWFGAANQREQLATLERYVSDLQAELENQGSSQVDYETQLNELRRELSSSRNQINSLQSELATAQEQIDPEIVLLEQQIRERVIMELQQSPQQLLSRTELIKQLNDLGPLELGQLMSLQATYGGFLQKLDVDESRMEVLIDGLGNIMEEQNQRRMQVIEEISNNPDAVERFREQLFTMNSPDAQRDALSFLLSDEELAVYDEFREEQQQNGVFQTQAITLSGSAASPSVIFSGIGTSNAQSGQGQSAAISIISSEDQDN
ncbi:MAG: hypothetical protein MI746_16150 [Pseudomonadales bacterium]|nr:hypothetical protein [Pseudomonadales bacterium]